METKIINLPNFEDPRGNLSFVEEENHIPLRLNERIGFMMYPVVRCGGHAFKVQREFIIALSGSFDVVVDDGSQNKFIL